MLHPLDDRERLRLLYAAEPLRTVRARNILYGLPLPDVRILVDHPTDPRGALISHDGMLWDLYSPEPSVAHAMLDAFAPAPGRAIFVGLAEPLIEHVRRRFELLVHTPTDLYVLGDATDLRGLSAATQPLVSLAPEHAPLVAAAWPHDDFEEPTGKLGYIRACIAQGPSVAAMEHGRLVSFVVTHTEGSMGVLHTEPEHRGRGLGRQVLSALVRQLRDRGAPIFGYVAVGNAPSVGLVESLGLRAVHRGAWLTVRC
jgi:ribosomal protein S18 acetylase RimI-like enzyme